MSVLLTRRLPAPERRRSILDAALTILADEGYEGMTTARVASRVGVAEPILYRHFPSKRAMIHALLDEVIIRMMDAFRKTIEGESEPVAALRRICRAYPELARRYRREFRIINQTLIGTSDPEIQKALTRHYDTYRAFLQNLIERGQRSGALRRDLPAAIGAWHMIHAALGFLIMQDVRQNVRSENELEKLADATLLGLMKSNENANLE